MVKSSSACKYSFDGEKMFMGKANEIHCRRLLGCVCLCSAILVLIPCSQISALVFVAAVLASRCSSEPAGLLALCVCSLPSCGQPDEAIASGAFSCSPLGPAQMHHVRHVVGRTVATRWPCDGRTVAIRWPYGGHCFLIHFL